MLSQCVCMGQGSYPHFQSVLLPPGKARRLKQAKEEAQMEVDQYRRERARIPEQAAGSESWGS